MNTPLAELLRCNKWANHTLIDACVDVVDDTLDATIAGISGSARVLLMHLVGGQQTFVLRTQGRQHEGELNRASAWPGFDALLELATRSSDDLIAIAESLDADVDIDLPFAGKTYRYPKSFFLVHAVTHSAEHRMEIKIALAQQGIATPDLDAWLWSESVGYGREV